MSVTKNGISHFRHENPLLAIFMKQPGSPHDGNE